MSLTLTKAMPIAMPLTLTKEEIPTAMPIVRKKIVRGTITVRATARLLHKKKTSLLPQMSTCRTAKAS